MPDNSERSRDPVEAGIDAVAAAIFGAIFGFILGKAEKAQIESQIRSRKLTLPDTLEFEGELTKPPTKSLLSSRWVPVALCALISFWAFSQAQYNNPFNWLRVLIAFVALGGAIYLGYVAIQKEAEKRQVEPPPPPTRPPLDYSKAHVYAIKLPKSTEWNSEKACRFVEQLLAKAQGKLTFQIVASHKSIIWRIIDLRASAVPDIIQQAVSAVYPEAEVKRVSLKLASFKTPFWRGIMMFQHTNLFIMPIRSAKTLKEFDPLASVVQEMSHLSQGESVTFTLWVAGGAAFAYKQGLEFLTYRLPFNPLTLLSSAGVARGAYVAAAGQPQAQFYDNQDTEVFSAKLNQLLFHSFLLVTVEAATEERVKDLMQYHIPIWQMRDERYNALMLAHDLDVRFIDTPERFRGTSAVGIINNWLTNTSQTWRNCSLILTPDEIATIWHLPHQAFNAPGILWTRGNQVQAPHDVTANTDGVLLGYNEYGGRRSPIHLPDKSRETPALIVGKAGSGKSNLLHHCVHSDIKAGKSVVVIDPHGNLNHDILLNSIPDSRKNDVVWLDLRNTANPPPLNPLRGLDNSNAVKQVVGIMESLYSDLRELVQTQDALTNALLIMQNEPEATFWDIDRLFSDAAYRNALVEKSANPVVRRFWQSEYNAMSQGEQSKLSAPIKRRIRAFYQSDEMRAILCHPQGLDFARYVQGGKIVLITLAANEREIGQYEQRLIGSLLVARLQMAAVNQAFAKTPCYCYIDELQHFAETSIDAIFSEGRKQGLSMTVAHQYLSQLRGKALEAAIGNIGTLVVFPVGHDDARELSAYTKPHFASDDLTSMDYFNAALWMRLEGKHEPAFSLATPPPLKIPDNERKQAEARAGRIIEHSVATYTPMTMNEVNEWLRGREETTYQPNDPSPFDDNK